MNLWRNGLEKRIVGLSPGTTYDYRAVAKNNGGVDYGETKSFTAK